MRLYLRNQGVVENRINPISFMFTIVTNRSNESDWATNGPLFVWKACADFCDLVEYIIFMNIGNIWIMIIQQTKVCEMSVLNDAAIWRYWILNKFARSLQRIVILMMKLFKYWPIQINIPITCIILRLSRWRWYNKSTLPTQTWMDGWSLTSIVE